MAVRYEYDGFVDDARRDAFGRERVSSPTNRFDIDFHNGMQDELVDAVASGNGSATFDTDAREYVLANGGTAVDDGMLFTSHIPIPYTPGNSQLVEVTGTLDNAGIGGGVAQLFLRSSVSGSVVEEVYDQDGSANDPWDNPLSGSFNWDNSQIFAIDYQSLRVGRVRYYFMRNGKAVQVHEINNDNKRTTGYWQTPTLPIYWRIYNDATYTYMEKGLGTAGNAVGVRYRIPKNAAATMRAICATVKSEGGLGIYDLPGNPAVATNEVTPITAVSTTFKPILAVRVADLLGNGLSNQGLYIPYSLDIKTDNPIYVEVVYRPTITGGSWATIATTYSGLEQNVTATAISGGRVKHAGYVATTRNTDFSVRGLLDRVIMAKGYAGVNDIIAIRAKRDGNTDAAVQATMGIREIV